MMLKGEAMCDKPLFYGFCEELSKSGKRSQAVRQNPRVPKRRPVARPGIYSRRYEYAWEQILPFWILAADCYVGSRTVAFRPFWQRKQKRGNMHNQRDGCATRGWRAVKRGTGAALELRRTRSGTTYYCSEEQS